MPESTTTAARVRALGLDTAGYREPDTGDIVPWDAPADRLADLADADPGGEPYTVFEYLTDQAGAHGMPLDEYLDYLGASAGDGFEE